MAETGVVDGDAVAVASRPAGCRAACAVVLAEDVRQRDVHGADGQRLGAAVGLQQPAEARPGGVDADWIRCVFAGQFGRGDHF